MDISSRYGLFDPNVALAGPHPHLQVERSLASSTASSSLLFRPPSAGPEQCTGKGFPRDVCPPSVTKLT